MKIIFYPFVALLLLVAAVTVLYKTTAAGDSGVLARNSGHGVS